MCGCVHMRSHTSPKRSWFSFAMLTKEVMFFLLSTFLWKCSYDVWIEYYPSSNFLQTDFIYFGRITFHSFSLKNILNKKYICEHNPMTLQGTLVKLLGGGRNKFCPCFSKNRRKKSGPPKCFYMTEIKGFAKLKI